MNAWNFHKDGSPSLTTNNTTTDLPLWGIEFSDSVSFFTLFTPQAQFVQDNLESEHVTDTTLSRVRDITFHDAAGTLVQEEAIDGNELHRTHTFTCSQGSDLLDFVSRYVFPKELFHSATIAGNTIQHNDNNIYHQFAAAEGDVITLHGNSDVSITINKLGTADGAFTPHAYVRDERGSWVVHIRLLPAHNTNTTTKLNAGWYNKALPAKMQKALQSIPGFKNWSMYRGERKEPWPFTRKLFYKLLPINSYPLAHLKKSQDCSIASTARLVKTPKA